MTRKIFLGVLVTIPIAALGWWVARNTYWGEVTVPVPLRGEALTNPFYAAQRFAEGLGARTRWDRVFATPAPDAVIVLTDWRWNLSGRRREALERWVESGGRLVVDGTLAGETEFERWSGVEHAHQEPPKAAEDPTVPHAADPCPTVREALSSAPPTAANGYRLCDIEEGSFLRTARPTEWALRSETGFQAVRVRIGAGQVTTINATPFSYRELFNGDHGALFVAATQLRRGDTVHFLTEEDHPSLLTLIWQYGGPVVILALALAALALWRNAARFGPLAAPVENARRSLAEQIRGTGYFTLRQGGGDVLHAACVRALHEAAERRVAAYARLSGRDRAAAIARLTGFDAQALAVAVYHPDSRQPQELRSTMALLEAARRRLLAHRTKVSYGTD